MGDMTASLKTPLTVWLKSHLPAPLLRAVKKPYYAHKLRAADLQEEPDLSCVRGLISPGDLVVDAGANFGLYTKFLSQWVGTGGRVISVEPVAETFQVLNHNVKALGLSNVTPVWAAVSDAPGELSMEVPREAGAQNFYMARVAPAGTKGALRVKAVTLDELAGPPGPPVAFIKLDVESHEPAAVRGAAKILRDFAPAWLIEVSGNPDAVEGPAKSLFNQLSAAGYSAWWFDGKTLHPRQPGDRKVNYFFLTEKHLAGLKQRGGILES